MCWSSFVGIRLSSLSVPAPHCRFTNFTGAAQMHFTSGSLVKFEKRQCRASLKLHLSFTSAFWKWKPCDVCKTMMWNVTKDPFEFHESSTGSFLTDELLVKLVKQRCGAPQDRILHFG